MKLVLIFFLNGELRRPFTGAWIETVVCMRSFRRQL